MLWQRVVLGGVRADAAIDRGGPTSVPLAKWRPPGSAALHRHPAAVLHLPLFQTASNKYRPPQYLVSEVEGMGWFRDKPGTGVGHGLRLVS